MTSLHRYCPDHDPGHALCGLDLAGTEMVADEDEALAAETMPACVVCSDLSPMACQDACLGARSEVA